MPFLALLDVAGCWKRTPAVKRPLRLDDWRGSACLPTLKLEDNPSIHWPPKRIVGMGR